MSTTDHQDAARYRWLRQAWLEGLGTDEEPEQLNTTIGAVYTEAEMDAAIDAVLAAHPAPAEVHGDERAALERLTKAVEYELDPDWGCESYHPSLAPALKQARAALSATQPKGTLPGRDWLEGMVSAWRTNAAEHEGEGWHTSADAFRTCAADLERALRLNPRAALPSPAPAPELTDERIDAIAEQHGLKFLVHVEHNRRKYVTVEDVTLRAVVRACLGIPSPAVQDGALTKLLTHHAALLEHNSYAYFELAYTRSTGWMAWITDKPAKGEPGTAEYARSRKVIARGQGDTPEEAAADALAEMGESDVPVQGSQS